MRLLDSTNTSSGESFEISFGDIIAGKGTSWTGEAFIDAADSLQRRKTLKVTTGW